MRLMEEWQKQGRPGKTYHLNRGFDVLNFLSNLIQKQYLTEPTNLQVCYCCLELSQKETLSEEKHYMIRQGANCSCATVMHALHVWGHQNTTTSKRKSQMCLKCYSCTLSDHLYRMCYVPINVMLHYTLYRQMAGITGALAERGCPSGIDYL